jgi:hypothetical protein
VRVLSPLINEKKGRLFPSVKSQLPEQRRGENDCSTKDLIALTPANSTFGK